MKIKSKILKLTASTDKTGKIHPTMLIELGDPAQMTRMAELLGRNEPVMIDVEPIQLSLDEKDALQKK